jgi:hypothetical protein
MFLRVAWLLCVLAACGSRTTLGDEANFDGGAGGSGSTGPSTSIGVGGLSSTGITGPSTTTGAGGELTTTTGGSIETTGVGGFGSTGAGGAIMTGSGGTHVGGAAGASGNDCVLPDGSPCSREQCQNRCQRMNLGGYRTALFNLANCACLANGGPCLDVCESTFCQQPALPSPQTPCGTCLVAQLVQLTNACASQWPRGICDINGQDCEDLLACLRTCPP